MNSMSKAHHQNHRSTSSCAACKFLKRRCTPTCIFAPYFRSDEAKKFAKVHKVFGASNVGKILVEVPEGQREDTVNSLAYEAEARLRDPVYGCIGAIALLQRRMFELQHDLALARARLARYTSSSAQQSDMLTEYGATSMRSGCDNYFPVTLNGGVVVVGRGLEDCWCFNDEMATYSCGGGCGSGGGDGGGSDNGLDNGLQVLGLQGVHLGLSDFGQAPFPL